ncbi:hypothetical protein TeGR_g8898 [Tetraparma gracilis]|uniref:Uncharacterized protein n=1 Tax=Tetraparma gracilis TaxID=2962635 RepID=A0ABQ6NCA9_9STRA|nr:hypothetical protein TeGR_g8898 [Tetraparma gracilis]
MALLSAAALEAPLSVQAVPALLDPSLVLQPPPHSRFPEPPKPAPGAEHALLAGAGCLPRPHLSSFKSQLHLPSLKVPFAEGGGEASAPPLTVVAHFLAALHLSLLRLPPALRPPPPYSLVLAHPSSYTLPQKALLRDACLLSSFGPPHLVPESTAASLAYSLDSNLPPGSLAATLDFGAGTCDVTVARTGGGGEVLAVAGDPRLGGNDADALLAGWYTGGRGGGGERAVLDACREAKHRLCGELAAPSASATDFDPDPPPGEVAVDVAGHPRKVLTQAEFGRALAPLRPRLEALIRRSLPAGAGEVSCVVLTGGSSRLGVVRDAVRAVLPGAAVKADANPFTCVSVGAALRAGVISGNITDREIRNALMQDALPHAMGVSEEGGGLVEILGRGVKLPARDMVVMQVADWDQGGVTLVIGEEADGSVENVGTFTFMLHRVDAPGEGAGAREVEVWLEVTSEGKVKVEIYDEHDPEHRIKWGRRRGGEEGEAAGNGVLLVLVGMLFLLYVAVRVAFNEVIENEVGVGGGVGGGGEGGGGGFVEDEF